tara:strand:+ start:178409 stop:178585 length:177 start_codon:yes stop_codon:yes gene_type:complete
MLHRNAGLATNSFVADDWSWPEINKASPPGLKMWQSSGDGLPSRAALHQQFLVAIVPR